MVFYFSVNDNVCRSGYRLNGPEKNVLRLWRIPEFSTDTGEKEKSRKMADDGIT